MEGLIHHRASQRRESIVCFYPPHLNLASNAPCSRNSPKTSGPSGVGKTWLACAIGQTACRDNRSVAYHRWSKLCEDIALARGDWRHPRLIKSLSRANLLILVDFGLEPLDVAARHNLLEILEKRYGRRSTIVTSQLPVTSWHEVIGHPTCADAILDRLLHNAHRVELVGESLRRSRGKGAKTA